MTQHRLTKKMKNLGKVAGVSTPDIRTGPEARHPGPDRAQEEEGEAETGLQVGTHSAVQSYDRPGIYPSEEKSVL